MSKATEFLSFQREIVAGERRTFDGWIMAGDECHRRFGGNASDYARIVCERYGDKVTLSENTIRIYVGAVVRGIKRYDSVHNLVTLYDAEFTHRCILSLRGFVGNGEKRQGSVKAKAKAPKYVGSVRRALRKYEGRKLTANVIAEIVESLG